MRLTNSKATIFTSPVKLRRSDKASSCPTAPYVNALRARNDLRPSRALSHAMEYLLKLDTELRVDVHYKYLPRVLISVSSDDMILDIEFLNSGDREFRIDFPNNPRFNVSNGLCDANVDPLTDIVPALQTAGRGYGNTNA